MQKEKRKLKQLSRTVESKERKFEQTRFMTQVEKDQLLNMHSFIDFLEDQNKRPPTPPAFPVETRTPEPVVVRAQTQTFHHVHQTPVPRA